MQTVTLSLFRFSGAFRRLWAFSMMGFARPMLARESDLQFWKLCGSGTGEGFTPRLYPDVFAILCVWPDGDTARTRLKQAPVFQRYRARADEQYSLFLEPITARGVWSGEAPFLPEGGPGDGPLAALTRATVRPKVARSFWGRVPEISDVIGDNPDVLFKIGIGEVPLLQQVTFSIWPDAASMTRFARKDGPHARAIQAVREGGWFNEELYARFRVTDTQGHWSDLRNIGQTTLHESFARTPSAGGTRPAQHEGAWATAHSGVGDQPGPRVTFPSQGHVCNDPLGLNVTRACEINKTPQPDQSAHSGPGVPLSE